ncbi:MAG: hypothetical protein CL424_03910 [Acidimicrobiaceae bacterium]|nr:hypothetical protein [Acidimicrobiaceae bacterium]
MTTEHGSAVPLTYRVRDLVIVPLDEHMRLVVACDSSGGIGPNPGDTYFATAAEVAHFATRVALLEVLAVGAEPRVVVNNLCVERQPTGELMIAAIESLVTGLGPNRVEVTGSTEDNVPTTSTGMGVTVLGLASDADLRVGMSRAGDAVVCVGERLSAPDDVVSSTDVRLVTPADVLELRAREAVHEILPVGSRGIAYEAALLARDAGLAFVPDPHATIDLERSAGPSTCVLVSCEPSEVAHLATLRPGLPTAAVGLLDGMTT